MKLLLKEYVENLGEPGDIVEIARGYARNFLVPRGLAIQATPANVEQVKRQKKKMELKQRQRMEELKRYAEELSKVSITIPAKVGEGESLYGSVTEEDIIKALKNEGFEIERKHIQMAEHIKKLGVYDLHIRLAPEIEASIKVWIVEE